MPRHARKGPAIEQMGGEPASSMMVARFDRIIGEGFNAPVSTVDRWMTEVVEEFNDTPNFDGGSVFQWGPTE